MEPLHPMSTGELLDRTFALYRKNFVLFVGIAMVTHAVYLGYELLSIKPAAVIRGPRFGASYYLSIVLALAFLTIVTTISQAATVKAVAAVHLDQKTSIWAAYGSLRRRIFSVFGILLLVFLAAAVVEGVLAVLLTAVVAMASAVGGNNVLPKNGAANLILGFGIILGVLASFFALYVRYALAIQACVVRSGLMGVHETQHFVIQGRPLADCSRLRALPDSVMDCIRVFRMDCSTGSDSMAQPNRFDRNHSGGWLCRWFADCAARDDWHFPSLL